MKQLKDLPNSNGFTFIGVCHDNSEIVCHIRSNGSIHIILDMNNEPAYSKLKGWK
jgi:hypothetical protein